MRWKRRVSLSSKHFGLDDNVVSVVNVVASVLTRHVLIRHHALCRRRYSPVFLSDSVPRTNPAPKPVDATLEAGDVLYLPAFWVHEAATDAERPSLHLTITPKTQRYRCAMQLYLSCQTDT